MSDSLVTHPIVRVVCVSLSPMLQHSFNEISIDPRFIEEEIEAFNRLSRRKRAQTTLYRGPDSEMGFSFEMLNALLHEACEIQERLGVVPAILGMPFRDFIPFDSGTLHADWDHPKDPRKNIRDGWVPDVRSARGSKVTRAKFPDWGFTACVYVATADETTLRAVKDLFNFAGLTCGLGAYRPTQGGPFGTFAVIEVVAEPP